MSIPDRFSSLSFFFYLRFLSENSYLNIYCSDPLYIYALYIILYRKQSYIVLGLHLRCFRDGYLRGLKNRNILLQWNRLTWRRTRRRGARFVTFFFFLSRPRGGRVDGVATVIITARAAPPKRWEGARARARAVAATLRDVRTPSGSWERCKKPGGRRAADNNNKRSAAVRLSLTQIRVLRLAYLPNGALHCSRRLSAGSLSAVPHFLFVPARP